MNTRKKVKTEIKSCLKDVKTPYKHNKSGAIVGVLRGVAAVIFDISYPRFLT